MTNPPYMGSSGMNARLSQYVKDHFPDTKADLFSCFIERGFQLANVQGFVSMITMESWMFLSSFEKMRQNIVNTHTIVNMVHMPYLGKGGTSLGINFGTAAVIFNKRYCRDYNSQFDYICYYETDENGVPFAFPTINERYKAAKATNFSKIPGSPVAYWVSAAFYKIFETESIGERFDVKAGICTGKNESFIFLWHEVNFCESSIVTNEYKYTPHNKGGEYRKWYGNRDVFLKYSEESLKQMEANAGFRHDGREYYFKPHIGWSKITSANSSFRYFGNGFTFDSAGLGLFSDDANMHSTLAILNSKVVEHLISILNPTLNVTPMIVKKLPYSNADVTSTVENCIAQSMADWDSYETSWDFKRNPLV